MTLTNSVVAKLSVAFVAIAFALSLVAPAQAQTAEELQATIDSLMAQIAALNTEIGVADTASSASVCPYTWTRSLSSGSTGADVMALQQFLNGSADTQVAAAGSAGGPGSETSYYGPATAAAVSNFQVKYRTDILSPVGLVNPTGYFGPSTMGKANALCILADVVVDDTMDDDMSDDDMDDDSDDDGPVTLEGEASLDRAELNGADDDELAEGDEDAAIAEFEIEFADGDAEVSRVDIALEGSGDEQDPWDTFETLSLWVDGEKIAEKNADDKDDYLDEDDGSMRFTGLDLIAMEDDRVTITIAATIQGSVDIGTDSDAWTVEIDSVRFFDADDVATTDTATGDIGDASGESFTIDEEGGDDELVVKTSSNDKDAQTLALKDDSDSDWYTIFVFDLDTDDSENDIELNDVVVTVDVSSSTVNTLVDDFEIVIDGTTIDDWDYDGGADDASRDVTFNVDGDVVIDAGDRVAVEVMVKFNSLNSGDEGTTISASTDADDYDAEGADDLDTTQLQGAASSEDHTLRTSGITFSDFSSSVSVETNDTTADDSYAEFTLEFDVTAIGEDEVYIPLTDAVWDSFASGTAGAVYYMEDSDGNRVASSSADQLSAVLSLVSGGDETDNGNVLLYTDETATLELVITFNPGSADQYKAVLDGIGFMLDDAADNLADEFETASPASEYDSSAKNITS